MFIETLISQYFTFYYYYYFIFFSLLNKIILNLVTEFTVICFYISDFSRQPLKTPHSERNVAIPFFTQSLVVHYHFSSAPILTSLPFLQKSSYFPPKRSFTLSFFTLVMSITDTTFYFYVIVHSNSNDGLFLSIANNTSVHF